MTTSPPSPESMAQARAELPMASIAAQSGDKTSARLLAERATVIELRRLLAEKEADAGKWQRLVELLANADTDIDEPEQVNEMLRDLTRALMEQSRLRKKAEKALRGAV